MAIKKLLSELCMHAMYSGNKWVGYASTEAMLGNIRGSLLSLIFPATLSLEN